MVELPVRGERSHHQFAEPEPARQADGSKQRSAMPHRQAGPAWGRAAEESQPDLYTDMAKLLLPGPRGPRILSDNRLNTEAEANAVRAAGVVVAGVAVAVGKHNFPCSPRGPAFSH